MFVGVDDNNTQRRLNGTRKKSLLRKKEKHTTEMNSGPMFENALNDATAVCMRGEADNFAAKSVDNELNAIRRHLSNTNTHTHTQ